MAVRIGADGAGGAFGQRPAARTQAQIVPQIVDALAEPPGFGFRPLEQGHGHAHGRFRPEAGQARQLLYQCLQRFGYSLIHTSSLPETEAIRQAGAASGRASACPDAFGGGGEPGHTGKAIPDRPTCEEKALFT